MSSQWIDPSSCRSLVILVESVTAPLLMQHQAPVCLDIDIDAELAVPSDPIPMVELLRALTRQALDEMLHGGDLTITACETADGVELEMADTGSDVGERSKRIPLAAAAIGAQIRWQNCAQGGGAVTVVFPRRSQSRRKAA